MLLNTINQRHLDIVGIILFIHDMVLIIELFMFGLGLLRFQPLLFVMNFDSAHFHTVNHCIRS